MPESAEKLIGNWKTWVAELTRCVVEQVHGKERVLVVEGLEKVGNWTEKMAGMLRERVRDDADGGVVGRVRVRMRRGECKVLLSVHRRAGFFYSYTTNLSDFNPFGHSLHLDLDP